MKKILELVAKIVLLVKKLNWVRITWISMILFGFLLGVAFFGGFVGLIFSGKTAWMVSAAYFFFLVLVYAIFASNITSGS